MSFSIYNPNKFPSIPDGIPGFKIFNQYKNNDQIPDGLSGAFRIFNNAVNGICKFIQYGNKMIGTGYAGTPSEGQSVSLSRDGKTLAIGGYNDNGNIGATWIFIKNDSSEWVQQGNKLVGSGSIGTPNQGVSVSLSSDGNVLAVGGNEDNGGGAVWIFTRNSFGVWSQQTKIIPSDSIGGANFGISIALSDNGNTLAIGGNVDNTAMGATWVYTQSGGVWSEQAKLVGTGSMGSFIFQGSSVSLSADGNILAVGGPLDNNKVGATWLFTRSGGVWTQLVKLVGTGGIVGAFSGSGQGTSVSLSGDGKYLAVGSINDQNDAITLNEGATWIFTQSGGVWSQLGSKIAFQNLIATQGKSESFSYYGDVLAIGTKNSGVFIFKNVNNTFILNQPLIFPSDGDASTQLGSSTGLSGDGEILAFGASGDNSGIGATWIYNC